MNGVIKRAACLCSQTLACCKAVFYVRCCFSARQGDKAIFSTT